MEAKNIWEEMTTDLLRRWRDRYTVEAGKIVDQIADAEKWGDADLTETLQHQFYKLNGQVAEIDAELVKRAERETSEAEDGAPLH